MTAYAFQGLERVDRLTNDTGAYARCIEKVWTFGAILPDHAWRCAHHTAIFHHERTLDTQPSATQEMVCGEYISRPWDVQFMV